MAKAAKRAKRKQTAEERAEIDRDREAAHNPTAEQEEEGDVTVLDKPDSAPELVPNQEADVLEQIAPDAGEGEASAADEGEAEEEVSKPNSVVAPKFKKAYIENARAQGIAGKAAKRSNWDWLSQQIARVCLDDKHKISIPMFIELLDLNGVDHSRWTNRNKGWEGRFRMTGRVALQRVVANAGHLKTAEGNFDAPEDFIKKFKTKE